MYVYTRDTTMAGGQPGIGVRGAPSGNTISQVQLGGIYSGAPTMPPTNEFGVSAFANKVEIQGPGASEPNGPGVAFYEWWRNGNSGGTLNSPTISDTSVSPSTNYTYYLVAVDFDLNSTQTTFSVTTPPAGAIDPRETGVRPTGAYWGGGGEQIDMRSGNLNYTMPLLKAMGRGGWSVGFNLTYNSQNWRQDPGGTWQLGEDVGYGYGWKLLVGSLLPLYGPGSGPVYEYLFTDSTGAQYHLNQNNGGIWTSEESVYVTYDANAGKLHFNDGSFWVIACTSAGTEWDAGTMYPTLMEDSNGNQVIINYKNGDGVTWANSSSRVATIEDVRGNGSADYTFSYNNDAIPHLTGITNTIGTAEKYSFAYTEGYALTDPFAGTNFGTVSMLESSTVTGIPLTTYFTYDTATATTSCNGVGTGTSGAGQLTQVTTPYCGHLRWTYTTANTLSGSRTYNEVQNRYLSMSSGAAETEISLVRASDTAYTVHSSATLEDLSANANKVWTFQTSTSSPYLGLETSYEEQPPSGYGFMVENFTWARTPTSLNRYIGTTVTNLSPGAPWEADKQTTQTLDQYGNVLTVQAYNFGPRGGGVGSLARTTTNTYLYQSNSTYASYYILNRLVSSTVTDGANTATLVSNTYDGTTIGSVSGPNEHDPNYTTSFTYRGNVTSSVTPTTNTINYYDMTGNLMSTAVNGVSSTVTTTSATNYAAPSQMTTNSLTSTASWSPFLGFSSATGPNGNAGSVTYDANGRPSTSTSQYGAVTNYTYNDTASPPNMIGTTNGHWVETVMDGFGRAIQTISGYGTTTVSTKDMQYAPAGCSPLGKLSQQSEPYAPGGTDAWTTYTYDPSGRLLWKVLPDGSTTTYGYDGNWVVVTDPAGNEKSFMLDAFGNLIEVQENDPALGSVYTNYTYDVLNHLTSVSMPRGSNTQTRSFNYTSGTTVGGFLLSATNPETGTVTYTYNSNNLLASKNDGKGQNLTYQYDSYNRRTSTTWTNAPGGPQVLRSYMYDTNTLSSFSGSYTKGRLVAVQNAQFQPGSSASPSAVEITEMYAYTQAGETNGKRLQVNETVTSGVLTSNLDTLYTYDNEGKTTSVSYPATSAGAGPVYTTSYDNMSRLNGMTGQNNNTDVSGVSYNAANQMLGVTYFGATETRQYNSLLQLTQLSVTGSASLSYAYNYPSGTNNGQISSQVVSGETISYQYDSLKRLISASSSAGWADSYGYDSFGNLLSMTPTAGSPPQLSQAVNPANNQIVGQTYDANGNELSAPAGGSLTYDSENRMVGAPGM